MKSWSIQARYLTWFERIVKNTIQETSLESYWPQTPSYSEKLFFTQDFAKFLKESFRSPTNCNERNISFQISHLAFFGYVRRRFAHVLFTFCMSFQRMVLFSAFLCGSLVWNVNSQACDFEVDFCGWTQGKGATVDWVRKQGFTNGGPKFDQLVQTKHLCAVLMQSLIWVFCICSTSKTNTSYYLFFASASGSWDYWDYSSSLGTSDYAKLQSPKIDGTKKICLNFWLVNLFEYLLDQSKKCTT